MIFYPGLALCYLFFCNQSKRRDKDIVFFFGPLYIFFLSLFYLPFFWCVLFYVFFFLFEIMMKQKKLRLFCVWLIMYLARTHLFPFF